MSSYKPHDPNKVTKNHIYLISNLNWSDFEVFKGDLTDLIAKEPTMMSSEITELLDKGTITLSSNMKLIQTFNYELKDTVEIAGTDYIIDDVFSQADPLTGINKLLITLMDISCLLGMLKVENFEDFDICIENDTYVWAPAKPNPFQIQVPPAKHQIFRASESLQTPIFKYPEPEKHNCNCSSYDLFQYGCRCGGK
jgi:hypothetical protein